MNQVGVRRRWAIGVLIVGCAFVAVEAWLPLGPTHTTAERDAPVVEDAGVTFSGRSVLESAEAPEWLGAAIDSGSLQVDLSFNAASIEQRGPARLLAITRDVLNANLMIGQDRGDLIVRVRRPGSDRSGHPGYVVPAGVRPGAWQDLSLTIDAGRVRVVLDDRLELDEKLSVDSTGALSTWDRGYRVALGDELDGDREWRGTIRSATIVAAGDTVDLLAPGTLEVGTDEVVIVRDRTILRPPDDSPLAVALRLLIFLPVGVALAWLVPRRLLLVAIGIALPLVLAVGKLFVAGRHPGVVEVLVGVAGIAIGALVGRAVARPDRASRLSCPGARRR